jgi:hypothetical protein
MCARRHKARPVRTAALLQHRKPPSGNRDTYRIEESFRRGITVGLWIGATLTVQCSRTFGLFRPPADAGTIGRCCSLRSHFFAANHRCYLLTGGKGPGPDARSEVSAYRHRGTFPAGRRARSALEWHDNRRDSGIVRIADAWLLRSPDPGIQVIRIEGAVRMRFAAPLRDLCDRQCTAWRQSRGNRCGCAQRTASGAGCPTRSGSSQCWQRHGPSLWEYAFFNPLGGERLGGSRRRWGKKIEPARSAFIAGDALHEALSGRPRHGIPCRSRPAWRGRESKRGAYQVLRGRHKRFGDTLWLHPSAGDGAARNGTQRRETSIHGPVPGGGFLGRLHRLRDWTDGGVGLTHREIEELIRVVPEGTPVEVRP